MRKRREFFARGIDFSQKARYNIKVFQRLVMRIGKTDSGETVWTDAPVSVFDTERLV